MESRSSTESVSGNIFFDVSFTAISTPEDHERVQASGPKVPPLQLNEIASSSFSPHNYYTEPLEASLKEEDFLCNGIDGDKRLEQMSGKKSPLENTILNGDSDYSPIWNYSCKLPTSEMSNENKNEETIYETVYPTDQNDTLFNFSFLDSTKEDAPPPLPPRTKSLRDTNHRPLERSMAVHLGAPPNSIVKGGRPPPALPPSEKNSDSMASLSSETSSNSLNNNCTQPSVRPKSHMQKKYYSSKSADSESSASSTSVIENRVKPASFDSFSYEIVDTDEVPPQSKSRNSWSEAEVNIHSFKPSFDNDLNHSSRMQSNTLNNKKENTFSIVSPDMKAAPDMFIAPLATPEQDSSLQEALPDSMQSFLNESESIRGSSSHSDFTPGTLNTQSYITNQDTIKQMQDSLVYLESSPECSSNTKLNSFCARSLCLPVNKSNVASNEKCIINDDACKLSWDETVTSDLKKQPPDTKSSIYNNGYSLYSHQANSIPELVSPNGAQGMSVSSREGRSSGSESMCLPLSMDSSTSSSVFVSPSNEVEGDMSCAGAVFEGVVSETTSQSSDNVEESDRISQQDSSQASGKSARHDQALPAPPPNHDTPPAVPPHKPHHKLLKSLVCPPTPTHHAKPQPPERTTSDRREKELSGREIDDKKDDSSVVSNQHQKLNRRPSFRDWLQRHPKVEVPFDDSLPNSK